MSGCQEWEIRIADNEIGPEVEAHLAVCPACRELAEELRANADVLAVMREEAMPPVALPKSAPSPWRWASAIAAMLVAGIGLWHAWGPVQIPSNTVDVRAPLVDPPRVEPPMPVVAQVRRVSRPVRRASGHTEPMMVKLLTPDPDVVIYWLSD
jgi:hypothetical protein